MSVLGDALAVMHDAAQRYQTLTGTVRHWQETALKRTALDRYVTQGGYSNTARPLDEEPSWEVVSDVTVALPDRYREERRITAGPATAGAGMRLLIVSGQHWCIHRWPFGAFEATGRPNGGSYTASDITRLLDPRWLSVWLDLEVVGTATVASRAGIRLSGTPRPLDPAMTDDRRPWNPGATASELVIDAERGVVLRSTAFLDDHQYEILEFRTITFDPELASDAFALAVPDGEELRPLPQERELTLADCCHLEPFTAWLPPNLDQVRHVCWSEPWANDDTPVLEFRLYFADQGGFVDFTESQASATMTVGVGARTVEMHGATAYLWEDQVGYSCIACVFSGTKVHMRGNVDTRTIIDLAHSLRPASEVVA